MKESYEKRSKEPIPKRMQRGLIVITLQGTIEKSTILLSQYWKFEWLDGTIIISYFGGSNNIFADCIWIVNTVYEIGILTEKQVLSWEKNFLSKQSLSCTDACVCVQLEKMIASKM